MAEFYSVSLEEMDAFLRPMRFQPVDLTYRRRPVKEWVYQRPVPSRANHFVRVYTGINRYGQQQNQSRGVGKDAIRVQVIYRDEAGNETLVTQPKRVHRVQGWADNLANRLEEINRTRPQVAFDSRGKPMTLRKGKTGWFWGSSDYPRYKETRPFVAETYEAAYQPDQTLQDYSVSQLTTSSAISGYQPYKYSASHGAESYQERDNRIMREREDYLYRGLSKSQRDKIYKEPMRKYGYRRIKRFKTPEEFLEFSKNRNRMGRKERIDNHIFVCDFDWYVKRITNNPIYTLYGHIIPLNNFTYGWSDQPRRDDKLMKRYGAPIFVQSPRYREIITELNDVKKISDASMTHSTHPLVGDGLKGHKRFNPDKDSVLIINMKGLKFAYGKGYFWDFADIMVLGGLPVKNVVDYRYQKPEYKELNGQQHWKVGFAAEDNYEATYGVEQAKIRRRLKKKIKAQAIMGTEAGQWSARKSQELKRQYEAACEKRGLAAYKGQKTQSQKNLSNWSQQKWRTASGKNSSDTGEPYFPAKAVEALKKKGLYAKAKRQKAAATKAGKQSARYSDDIRAVVRKYRAESDAIPKNWELIEYEGHPALYRHIATADYNTTWQLVEFADDLNLRLKHHATVQFTASSIEIWLWTHDSETITYRDEYWAEAYDELLQLATVVDNLEFDSESVPEGWEDIKWKEEKPEHIGDEAEWESEQGSDWGSLRPMQLNERGDYYPSEEAYIEAMLRRFPKMNIHGERGCPVCGSETLFMRETTGKGLKWRCYGCNYSDERLSEKSKKIDTLEKFGLTIRCPDCGEDFKAYNREAIRYHQKKCGA